ncbi:hypothetical protein LTS18_007729 [Coniosporium uncinatum]|uniref:Uncharacterized protein n=1 Tax=Coniosporium uncinatum TaxID=93489 RepID=A0ACC3D2P8_9PEZI|nr:hypothetical protein LTS18_007729 [Coniosporium uncinatum]
MATTTASHTQPASSPSPRRHRKKKQDDDPFYRLPSPSTSSSDLVPVASTERPRSDNEETETLFTRTILSPLRFITFLFSLYLVDRRNRAWRVSNSFLSPPKSFWTRFSPLSWLDPEPYQNPLDSSWQTDTSGGQPQHGANAKGRGTERWFTRKMHRKMGRMQLADALDLSQDVMLMLVGCVVVGLVMILYGIHWMGKGRFW